MRQYVARPGQECKSELIVGAGLERVRWTAWYNQFWWLVQWNQGMYQGTNGAWDAFWKQAMSRQRKYGWAAYSRPGMQWMKKILKWPLMFSSMVQIWLWKRKTGVTVKVCILEESEQGTKAGGGAVPWKQLWQFWNWFDGVQGASAGRPELAWCGSTETFVQQLEQGCSEPTEGEQDLMQRCLQEENYNSQGESRLLPRLPFLLLQWSRMNECGAELECENMMPYKSRKHAYRKTYESLGKHLDFL